MKTYEKPQVKRRETLQKISAIFYPSFGGSGISQKPKKEKLPK